MSNTLDQTTVSTTAPRPASKRTARRARHSTPGSSSTSSSSLSAFGETLKDLAGESPASEALSLTDEDELGCAEYDEEEGVCALGTDDLDDVWDFVPKSGDAVWVKSKDTERETWYLGRVQSGTRSGTVRGGKQGTFYSVRYRRNVRRYFAPLLGDIKPDTPRVRRLLELAGCDVIQ